MLKKTVLFIGLFTLLSITLNAQEIGTSASNFKGRTTDKKAVKYSNYKGKVLILTFFASWCESTYDEFPHLIKLHKMYNKSGLEIVGVNIDLKKKKLKAFKNIINQKIPFPIIWDKRTKIPDKYKLSNLPTTLFIDKKGIIRQIHLTFNKDTKKLYTEQIEELLFGKIEPRKERKK